MAIAIEVTQTKLSNQPSLEGQRLFDVLELPPLNVTRLVVAGSVALLAGSARTIEVLNTGDQCYMRVAPVTDTTTPAAADPLSVLIPSGVTSPQRRRFRLPGNVDPSSYAVRFA